MKKALSSWGMIALIGVAFVMFSLFQIWKDAPKTTANPSQAEAQGASKRAIAAQARQRLEETKNDDEDDRRGKRVQLPAYGVTTSGQVFMAEGGRRKIGSIPARSYIEVLEEKGGRIVVRYNGMTGTIGAGSVQFDTGE